MCVTNLAENTHIVILLKILKGLGNCSVGLRSRTRKLVIDLWKYSTTLRENTEKAHDCYVKDFSIPALFLHKTTWFLVSGLVFLAPIACIFSWISSMIFFVTISLDLAAPVLLCQSFLCTLYPQQFFSLWPSVMTWGAASSQLQSPSYWFIKIYGHTLKPSKPSGYFTGEILTKSSSSTTCCCF